MNKQIFMMAMLVSLLSLNSVVNAEPLNCNCDCHKNNSSSNAVEIGYPNKSENQSVSSSLQYLNNSSNTNVQVSVPNTTSNVNLTNSNYSGNIVKTTAHFGNNVSDNEGNRVVNEIGKKLMSAANIDKNVYFVYSTDKSVNAQTEFNGTVTVFKGIMGCCENEDELAFVIGHELGHADGYHVAKSVAVNAGLTYGANEAQKVLNKNISSKLNSFGLTKGTWSNAAVNKAQELGSASYSKAHENDADLNAVDYLVKCGYNPLAGISVLNKIDGTYPDLFADHPSTDKRVQSIYNYVKEKYPQYISQGYNSTSYNQAIQTYVKNDN